MVDVIEGRLLSVFTKYSNNEFNRYNIQCSLKLSDDDDLLITVYRNFGNPLSININDVLGTALFAVRKVVIEKIKSSLVSNSQRLEIDKLDIRALLFNNRQAKEGVGIWLYDKNKFVEEIKLSSIINN